MGQCFNKEEAVFKTHSEYITMNTSEALDSCVFNALSSPSTLETNELTTVYRIPSGTESTVLKERNLALLREIDEGGFAKVHLARDMKTNTIMACKIVDLTNKNPNNQNHHKRILDDVKNELFVLEKIKHPFIIRMHCHFIINNNLYIFLDYANHGNMFTFMRLHGALSENVAKKPFAQILSAVSYMHAKRIAHRDLKLSNVLLLCDNMGYLQVLITDFGLSRVVYRTGRGMLLCNSYCGTPNYMSPQMKLKKPYNAFLADIYALGTILFVILNCSYPFDSRNEEKGLQQSLELKINWNPRVKLGIEVKDLIMRMLEPSEEKRIQMRQLIQELWFKPEVDKILYSFPNVKDLPSVKIRTDLQSDSNMSKQSNRLQQSTITQRSKIKDTSRTKQLSKRDLIERQGSGQSQNKKLN